MSTILIATGETGCMKALGETRPVPMLPLIDRPFIQHVVEFLAGQGRKDLDIILSHLPQQIETLLGDGSRWGCTFRYHLVRNLSQVSRTVRTIMDEKDEPCLLVDATAIPQIELNQTDRNDIGKGPVFYCLESEKSRICDAACPWTGWAWLPQYAIRVFPVLDKWEDLYHWAHVRFRKRCSTIKTQTVLRMDTYSHMLAAHRQVLDKQFTGLMVTGTEVEEGIWLSRNVELHPYARIVKPVHIGQDCHIGKGVQIGPYAVIGRNCVLDERSTISDAVIFPNTYVGEALELKDVIADKSRLINERYSSEVTITDEFILSNIRENEVRKWLSGLFSRAFAVILLMLTFPLLLSTFLNLKRKRQGQVLYKSRVVKLPSEYDQALWKTYSLLSFTPFREKTGMEPERSDFPADPPTRGDIRSHFLLTVLPGLINVARGDLQVIGVNPRTKDELSSLHKDWAMAYLKSKAGLITESFINFGFHASADEVYSAEMIYCASFTRKKDLVILGRYFGRLLRELILQGSKKK